MDCESWVFRVKAHDGESLGHFLGRFRRANELSHKAIAQHLGIRVEWVKAWESPSRRRNPTDLQLLALSKLVDVDCRHLTKMLPLSELHLQTRLCPACYAETPIHRVTWQQAGVECCDRHQLVRFVRRVFGLLPYGMMSAVKVVGCHLVKCTPTRNRMRHNGAIVKTSIPNKTELLANCQ